MDSGSGKEMEDIQAVSIEHMYFESLQCTKHYDRSVHIAMKK